MIFACLLLLAVAWPVLAQDFGLTETASRLGYNTSEKEPIYAKVQTVVGLTLSMLAIVFFIVMMYAGLRWMTSRGNEELATKAKHALEAGTIGLIICLASYGISNFVLTKLGGSEIAPDSNKVGCCTKTCKQATLANCGGPWAEGACGPGCKPQ